MIFSNKADAISASYLYASSLLEQLTAHADSRGDVPYMVAFRDVGTFNCGVPLFDGLCYVHGLGKKIEYKGIVRVALDLKESILLHGDGVVIIEWPDKQGFEPVMHAVFDSDGAGDDCVIV